MRFRVQEVANCHFLHWHRMSPPPLLSPVPKRLSRYPHFLSSQQMFDREEPYSFQKSTGFHFRSERRRNYQLQNCSQRVFGVMAGSEKQDCRRLTRTFSAVRTKVVGLMQELEHSPILNNILTKFIPAPVLSPRLRLPIIPSPSRSAPP